MKNKNRKRLRAGSLAAAKEISGDAALRAVLSEPGAGWRLCMESRTAALEGFLSGQHVFLA